MNDKDLQDLGRALRVERALGAVNRIERAYLEGLAWREAEAEPVRAVAAKAAASLAPWSETKDLGLPFAVKGVDEATGAVDGYLAVFENVDLGKDRIKRGAFAKTLGEARAFAARHKSRAIYPLLWQHDQKDPIGIIVGAKEDVHGLRIQCEIDPSTPHGRQALFGLKYGSMGFSIGYRPVQYDWEGGVRNLKEIALAEGSAVTFPMNTEARAVAA